MGGVRYHSRRWFAIALVVVLAPRFSYGWGPLAHQIIYRVSVQQMPPSPYRDWLLRNLETGTRQSTSPDVDWKPFELDLLPPALRERVVAVGPRERPAHFFDADLLLPDSAPMRSELMNTVEYADAVPLLRAHLRKNPATAKFADEPWEHGSVPWRTAQIWTLLVKALRDRDFARAEVFSAALTHYAAEPTNFLHSDSRYDGLMSHTRGRPGLHLGYEMHAFESAMEVQGAIRPTSKTGNWVVPQSVLEQFKSPKGYLPAVDKKQIVRVSLQHMMQGRPALEPLSTAWGAAPMTATGMVNHSAFFATTVAFNGFQGSIGDYAQQRIVAAGEFATGLLTSAYRAAAATSAPSSGAIVFPTEVSTFDRHQVIRLYPPSMAGIAVMPQAIAVPSSSLAISVHAAACRGPLEGLAK